MKLILPILLILSFHSYSQNHNYMLIGTYTQGASKGIHIYDFNSNTGKASLIDSAVISNPSYLAVSPSQKFVYAVNEDVKNGDGGKVSAYAFDKKNGHLTLINQASSGGDAPCYVTVDKTG